MSGYFIDTKSGRKGPFSIEKLQSLFDQSKLPKDLVVIDEESGLLVQLQDLLGDSLREDVELEDFHYEEEPKEVPSHSVPSKKESRPSRQGRTTGRPPSRKKATGRRRSSSYYAPRKKSVATWLVGGGLIGCLGIIGIMILLGGVFNVVKEAKNVDRSRKIGQSGLIKAKDKSCCINVPSNWNYLKSPKLGEDAVIYVGDLHTEQYCIVNRLEKEEDDLDINQRELLSLTSNKVREVVANSQTTALPNLFVGNNDAYGEEISGTVEGHNVVYWIYVSIGDFGYYQFIMWSLKSKMGQAEPHFRKVLQSFKEI